MTAHRMFDKLYPPPNLRESYECFSMEFFLDVAYQSTSSFSARKETLSQHYIIYSSSKAAGNILFYYTVAVLLLRSQ
jgi:hypothetical protein